MEIDVNNNIQGNTNTNIANIGNVNVNPMEMVNYRKSYGKLLSSMADLMSMKELSEVLSTIGSMIQEKTFDLI